MILAYFPDSVLHFSQLIFCQFISQNVMFFTFVSQCAPDEETDEDDEEDLG